MDLRRQLWALWLLALGLLACELGALYLAPDRVDPWHPAQTAVAGFLLALLGLTLGVSTFALRERLAELRAASEVRRTRLLLWARCLVVGALGAVLAWGAASPAAALPFVAAAAALLVIHAPRAPAAA
jgi:hypothetical protein